MKTNVLITASYGYANAFYLVTVIFMNMGIFTNLGIYTAQLFGAKNFRRVNVILRQSLLLNFIYMVIIPVPCYFLVGPVLSYYGKPQDLIDMTTGAIPRLYPMLFLRVINETLKNYI